MRTAILKWLLIISALLFADWLIMIFLGCFSSLCHANNQYFCSVYCYIGISLLSITLFIIGYLIVKSFSHKKLKTKQ
jgi:hypothetical protein